MTEDLRLRGGSPVGFRYFSNQTATNTSTKVEMKI